MARDPVSTPRRHQAIRCRLPVVFALSLLLTGMAACSQGTAAPQSTTLTYEGPQTYTLKPGDWVPGTDIRYIQQTAEGARFLIADQPSVKQKADSLDWTGSPAAGVRLEQHLRIVWFTQQALYAAGTFKVEISDVAPHPGAAFAEAPLSFQAPVTYRLAVGGRAPGTGLSYEGKTADGAKFGGIEGYPYRKAADSLSWEGQLRPNVALRLDLRVLEYDEQAAQVGGIAHLWIKP